MSLLFSKAKETRPKAFITKPFNNLNLQRTIELVIEGLKESGHHQINISEVEVMNDRIFVRHNGKLEKVLLEDILYIEADRNYCSIKTTTVAHLLSSTLKSIEKKLPTSSFIRVHRSFVVNISKLDFVTDGYLEIGRKVIPLGKSYKEMLMSRIQAL